MKMFLVHLRSPTRQIQVIDVTVKVCEKTVWAIDTRGNRHLVGSSIFQTLPAAERCRLALCERIAGSKFFQYHKPYQYAAAVNLLASRAIH